VVAGVGAAREGTNRHQPCRDQRDDTPQIHRPFVVMGTSPVWVIRRRRPTG
jgi:hypothetical protein